MRGRYASFLPPEAIAATFRTVNRLPNIAPTWNLAPTEDALVVRRHPETGRRHLDVLNWGFLPYWTKADPKKARWPINAKGETVATSGMFRDAVARRVEQIRHGRGHLSNTLPARGRVAPVEHHVALPWLEVSDWKGAFGV